MNSKDCKPNVAIIIPCFNEENFITACITSCLHQKFIGEIKVYVVDGMSTDNTAHILSQLLLEFPNRLHLLFNPKRVTPISLNIGLQEAQAEYKMILGAHSTLPPDYIQKCVQAFENHPEASCVGGIILNQYANATSESIGLAMSSPFGVGNATFRTGGEKKWVDTVAFGMYKHEVFEKIGWFNEDLIRNQDDEFNFRVTKAGFRILFDPSIHCDYFVRGSYRKLWKQYFQYGFWKVYVNILHQQVTSIRQLFPAAFVLYLLIWMTTLSISMGIFQISSIPAMMYLLAGLFFALRKKKSKWLYIALSFPILHLSYGLGYWKGIIQLGIFKIQPHAHHAQHNR